MFVLASASASVTATATAIARTSAKAYPRLSCPAPEANRKHFLRMPCKIPFQSVKAMAETPVPGSQSYASGRRPQAFISVYDKKNLSMLGNGLQELGYTIVSTEGTASALEAAGVSVTRLEELVPEMLDCSVKSLPPGIDTFDVVVVNLCPYDVSSAGLSFKDGIQKINIEGVNMIMSGLKNYEHTLVVVDPEDYPELLEFLAAK